MTAINRGGAINGVSYDDIASSATCQIFAAGAGIAANIAVGSAITGNIWGVVGGGAGLLGANALAAANGCFPVNPDDGPSSGGNGIAEGQCMEAASGCNLMLKRPDGSQYITVRKLISSVRSGFYPNGVPRVTTTFVNCDGEVRSDDEAETQTWPLTTEIINGDVCAGEPSGPPSNPLPDPVFVPDPNGGPCTFKTQIIDSYINAAGGMSILYETCSTGGPECSGCSRFWYHGPGNTQPAPPEPIPGPDGNPLPQPNPDGPNGPGGNCPDPCEPCRFEPCEKPTAEIRSREFEFTAPCDKKEDGSAAQVRYTLQGANKLEDCFEALAGQNQQIMQMLQQHLNWKTPICGNEKPKLKGNFVSIHFESDQDSPGGIRPLRKLFRYRTESTRSIEQLRDYWRDFVWNAGNTCVQHTGHSWGTPQVWAASEAEGKRVIQHAAGEAGFDANQVGEWRVSGSDDPRYGMSGKMRRSQRLGDYWLTSRDGPSGFDA